MKNNKINIFLAEDDKNDREFFQRALTKIDVNAQLTMFRNGEEIISHIKEHQNYPEFIFLDINMPKEDGVECLKYIKSVYPSNLFQVIMMSGVAGKNVTECYRYGASAYMVKTHKQELMVKLLEFCIKDLKNSTVQSDFILNSRFVSREEN